MIELISNAVTSYTIFLRLIMSQFTIFFDGRCPLCVNEMQHLDKLDRANKLHFFDIHNERLHELHPEIEFDKANRFLHGKLDSGQLLYGLDVTHRAWNMVGKGMWVAPLRWFWLKPIADKVYLGFAKHRFRISRLLTGQQRCEQSCDIKLHDKREGRGEE